MASRSYAVLGAFIGCPGDSAGGGTAASAVARESRLLSTYSSRPGPRPMRKSSSRYLFKHVKRKRDHMSSMRRWDLARRDVGAMSRENSRVRRWVSTRGLEIDAFADQILQLRNQRIGECTTERWQL